MKKIKLTKNKHALIDNDDYNNLSKHNWQYDGFYAGRNIKVGDKKTRLRMHVDIMNPPKGMVVDHIDGNRLNNQRNNLRICTQSDNQKKMKLFSTNTSGIQGISWDSRRNKWFVQKCYNRKRYTIGRFDKKEDAIIAYNNFCDIIY